MSNPFGRVPALEALEIQRTVSGAKWPNSKDAMGTLCLPEITPRFSIAPGDSIFTIGSCFARHIERALRKRGFKVPALDWQAPTSETAGEAPAPTMLNKYTPFSMLNEVRFAFGDSDGSEFLIEMPDGSFLDGQLHVTMATGVPLERALERRAELRALYRSAILASRVVIVTLGLSEAWWDDENGCYLNGTPPLRLIRRHPQRFYFEVLSYETVLSAVNELIELLHRANPDQVMLLTVSPVPFMRSFSGSDAIIANTYSKSVLRVAAETARRSFPWVDYYPSFESVIHSERSLAWKPDNIHVHPDLVEMNVRRMIKDYLATS